MNLIEQLEEASLVLGRFLGDAKPVCAVILGSGLNSYADRLEDAKYLPYQDVPHMPHSTVPEHVGRFVLGKVPGTEKTILAMQGRVHAYEGYSPTQVAFPVWLMGKVGIDILLTTNAAGAINPGYRVGDFCLMRDQINLTGRNPLVGQEANAIANRFVPMLDAFDATLRASVLKTAADCGISVHEGVYLGLLGPSFETPAEIRAFAMLGADTVAMSVCEEVIAARHVGMRVAGMSLITNMACGVEGGDPRPDDILDAAVLAEGNFAQLVYGLACSL